jgi:aspartate/methionine/tyrosine aminotransferase
MRWAKQQAEGIRHDLAQSGLTPPAAGLGLDPGDIDLSPRAPDMPPEARAAVARRFGVTEDHVMLTLGSSQALYLLCATHIGRDALCLVESPAYEALPGLVRLLGGQLALFERSFDRAYALPADLPARIVAERPAVVLLTSPHNPSGMHVGREALEPVARAVTEVGGLLIVDEVYLEFAEDVATLSATRLHGHVAVVSSLTKAYGLGGLRFGWIIAQPETVERATLYNDFVSVVYPEPSAAFGLAALGQLRALSARAIEVRSRNLPVVDAWIRSRDDVSWCKPDVGIVGFPKLQRVGDTRVFCEQLARRSGTLLVPGAFFGAPRHVRLGFAADREQLEAGLEHLARALDQHP